MGAYHSDFFKVILRNRFIVIIGDNNMMNFYKDVINFLQTDDLLPQEDLETKGKQSFNHDKLFDGGNLISPIHGKQYREVRQYQDPQHLIRFYFATKICSSYMKEILCSLAHDVIVPDYIIIGSCLWDISRYGPQSLEMYVQNVSSFCGDLKKIIHQFTCVIMTTSLPVSKLVKGGFLGKSDNPFGELLPFDQVLANHAAASIAKKYGFNILDLYFAMKGKIVNRNQDGVHWGPAGYREMTYYFIDILLKINPELRNF